MTKTRWKVTTVKTIRRCWDWSVEDRGSGCGGVMKVVDRSGVVCKHTSRPLESSLHIKFNPHGHTLQTMVRFHHQDQAELPRLRHAAYSPAAPLTEPSTSMRSLYFCGLLFLFRDSSVSARLLHSMCFFMFQGKTHSPLSNSHLLLVFVRAILTCFRIWSHLSNLMFLRPLRAYKCRSNISLQSCATYPQTTL